MIKTIKMKNNSKFKFVLNEVEFLLPSKFLRTHSYGHNRVKLPNPIIEMVPVAAASVIKQYVKKKYPKVVVSSSSESFSMGNAVNVYLSDEFGNGVDEKVYKDVSSFAKMFQYGKFNGMIDMYENNDSKFFSEKGTEIDMGVKFVSVNNRPMFGTVPDIVRMITDYTTTDNYYGGMVSLEKAIKNIKGYKIDDKKINKALTLMNS